MHPEYSGLGIGKRLMDYLIEESEKAGIWMLYSSIFPEDGTSIWLHQLAGFREIEWLCITSGLKTGAYR